MQAARLFVIFSVLMERN